MGDFNFTKWLLLILPMVLSAGPANIMCASLGGTQGLKKSVPFLAGLVIPAVTYSLLIGYGANTVIANHPYIVNILQYAGATYVLYLALKFIYPTTKDKHEVNSPTLGFRAGFLLSALNGKLISMLILMYSVMLDEQSGYGEVWLMTGMLFMIGISSNILWMIGGQLLSRFFMTPKAIRFQNIFFGMMLLVVAVWLVV